jgi:hypothetical protein
VSVGGRIDALDAAAARRREVLFGGAALGGSRSAPCRGRVMGESGADVYSCGEVVTSGCKKDAPVPLLVATAPERVSAEAGQRPTAHVAVDQSCTGIACDYGPQNERLTESVAVRVPGSCTCGC